jgi:hypothetical protein
VNSTAATLQRVRSTSWLPPLVAWLAAGGILCGAAAATGHDPFAARSWARYDSLYYQGIARHGYQIHRCAPHEKLSAASEWCGNTSWFPAYPLLIRAATTVGMPRQPAAVVVSWLAAGATLLLLWRWFLPRRAGPLAYAALAPGLVYLYAIFPMSVLALAGVVFLRHLERRPWVAGLAGAAVVLAYPLGVALVPIVVAVELWRRRGSRRLVPRALVLLGPACAAGAALFLVQWWQTGHRNAYADVTRNYGGLHNPITTITDMLVVLRDAANPFAYALFPIWQFLFVTLLLAVVAGATVRSRDSRLAPLLAWCIVVWFVPLIQSHQSLWRSEAALVLMAPLVALLPRRLVWPVAAALGVLAYGLAHEFFAGTLI